MPKYVNNETIRTRVRGMITYETKQRAIAKELGVSDAYLSEFLGGRKDAGPKILQALGYDTEPFYREAARGN